MGAVAEAFGLAFADARDVDKAIDWYRAAVHADDGSASFRPPGLGNQLARRGESRGTRWRRGATSTSVARLQKLVEINRRSSAGPARLGLQAAGWSRRAADATAAARRPAPPPSAAGAEPRSLPTPANGSRRCARWRCTTATPDGWPGANAANLFYPAKNGISAELRLAFLERRPAELAVDRMRAVQESLARASSERPDFWSVVGQIELRVLVAVAAQQLAGESAALIAEFTDLKARVPALGGMWDSVHSEARFTLEPYLGMADTAEKRAARRFSARSPRWRRLVSWSGPRPLPLGGRGAKRGGAGLSPLAAMTAAVRRSSTSAGNFDDRAGGVARRVREQPHDRLADLISGSGALHWQLRRDLTDAVGGAAGGVDLGVDDSGTDGVDAMPSAATSLARPMVKVSIPPLAAA
jgi:hypothetical protein